MTSVRCYLARFKRKLRNEQLIYLWWYIYTSSSHLARKNQSTANKVIALKKGYMGHPISFRPGNPVLVPSKLIESVMMDRITQHLDKTGDSWEDNMDLTEQSTIFQISRVLKKDTVMWGRVTQIKSSCIPKEYLTKSFKRN